MDGFWTKVTATATGTCYKATYLSEKGRKNIFFFSLRPLNNVDASAVTASASSDQNAAPFVCLALTSAQTSSADSVFACESTSSVGLHGSIYVTVISSGADIEVEIAAGVAYGTISDSFECTADYISTVSRGRVYAVVTYVIAIGGGIFVAVISCLLIVLCLEDRCSTCLEERKKKAADKRAKIPANYTPIDDETRAKIPANFAPMDDEAETR